jgi:hypothetical protein
MKEQNFDKSQQQEPCDLEQRLTSFYGPPLHDRSLPPSAWHNLRLQLDAREDASGKFHFKSHFRWPLLLRKSRTDVPTFMQDAFAHISYEARVPYMPSLLRCSWESQICEPVLRNSWLSKRKIRLCLPLNAATTMRQAELDVLLATGLARFLCARKPGYVLVHLLLACIVLLASIMLALLWAYHLPFVGIPIAVVLYVCMLWILHRQARSVAFQADTLIVLWLGREHVCNGLHSLADRSRAPMRRRWGEPSLAERIERVCGTQTDSRNNQLTLVG